MISRMQRISQFEFSRPWQGMRFLSSGGLVVMTIYRSMDIEAVVSRKQTDSRQMVQVYV